MTRPVDDPAPQYLAPDRVLHAMATFGRGRLEQLTLPRAFLLAVLGGGFITAGALFSMLLASGVETEGLRHLLMGLGFSALIAVAQLYPPAVLDSLAATVDTKMAYRDLGGPRGRHGPVPGHRAATTGRVGTAVGLVPHQRRSRPAVGSGRKLGSAPCVTHASEGRAPPPGPCRRR